MPSIKSRKIKILLTIILAVSVGFLIFPTYKTFASDIQFSQLKPRLSIEIPSLKFSDLLPPSRSGSPLSIPWIAEYIAAVYSYVVGIASLLAVAMIMWGGMKWIFAGGDSGKIGKARDTIINALMGLVLALGSYVLLYTINKNTVEFENLKLTYIPLDDGLIGQETVWDADGPMGLSANGDFKQGDKRWADHPYAYPEECESKNPSPEEQMEKPCAKGAGTICSSGCGPTSLANVFIKYGVSVTPVETADFASQVGARLCTGTNMAKILDSFPSSPWSNFRGDRVTLDNATERIREGHPIIFLCKSCAGNNSKGEMRSYAGHYMILTDVNSDADTYRVNDPGAQYNAMTEIDRDQLESNVSGFWYVHPSF